MPCKKDRYLFDPAQVRSVRALAGGRNPSHDEIYSLAANMYAAQSMQRYGIPQTPELAELKETGYWEDARRMLLGGASGRRNIRGYDPATSKQKAGYIERGPYPFVCGNCKFIVWGGSRSDSCKKVEGEISPRASCKLFEANPSRKIASLAAAGKAKFDPAKLPEPDDYPGIDNLNNLRLVPKATAAGYSPVKGLMEAQMVMPAHQFDAIRKKVEKEKNYKDLEYEDSDKDGIIDRIVRRGRRNNQTNIFIDRE